MNKKSTLVLSIIVLIIIGTIVISCVKSSTVELTGWFNVIIGDPIDSSNSGGTAAFLTDDQDKQTQILITSSTKFIGGQNWRDFDRKRVKIIGTYGSQKNIIEAISLELE